MRSILRAAVLGAMALALAACGDSGTGPSKQELDDASLAAITGLQLDAGVVSSGTGVTVVPLSGRALPPPTCRFNEASSWFECEAVTRDGLTFTRSYAFRDADGRPQRRFDPVTTASIDNRTTVSGTTGRAGLQLTMQQSSDMTVSGLEGAETSHTMNGTGSGTSTVRFSGPEGEYTSTRVFNDSTIDLVVPLPPRPEPAMRPASPPPPVWPLSGKRITNSVSTSTASIGGPAPLELRMREVTTYNGTSVITIERTFNGSTRVCTIDLASRDFVSFMNCQ